MCIIWILLLLPLEGIYTWPIKNMYKTRKGHFFNVMVRVAWYTYISEGFFVKKCLRKYFKVRDASSSAAFWKWYAHFLTASSEPMNLLREYHVWKAWFFLRETEFFHLKTKMFLSQFNHISDETKWVGWSF